MSYISQNACYAAPVAPLGSFIFHSLIKTGMPPDQAVNYALFAEGVQNFIQNDPTLKKALLQYKLLKDVKDIKTGVSEAVAISDYIARKAKVGMVTDVALDARGLSVATALSGVVDIMEVIAKQNNVELNPCAISIAKVSLDGVGIIGGGLSFATVYGAFQAAMSLYVYAPEQK